jgi:hypothetical protein
VGLPPLATPKPTVGWLASHLQGVRMACKSPPMPPEMGWLCGHLYVGLLVWGAHEPPHRGIRSGIVATPIYVGLGWPQAISRVATSHPIGVGGDS